MANDTLTKKYEEEKVKRQQASKGLAGFHGRDARPSFTTDNPFVEDGTPINEPVKDGGHVKVLIFGAGFGGVLTAVKCLDAGVARSPSDIVVVDPAGGFGGTWYWNQYPGLMCDIESYVYLPLLEQTGFIPSRRYCGGKEIREYIELIAKQWKFDDRAMFQSSGRALTWNKDHWDCEILQHGKGLEQRKIKVTADYVFMGTGLFTYPKVPNLPGATTFKGHQMHTGRWDYKISGGSSSNPVMDKFADKKVAIVGTGATAIQLVPHLAKNAGTLYVVQRTPSAVDHHNNYATDPNEWKTKIATKPGWQKERANKIQIGTEQAHELPDDAKFADGFSSMPSIAGAWGGPSNHTAKDVEKRIEELRILDDARSDKVRARAIEIVKDRETAEKLCAYYPGWCKRPTFHDEYLPSFNRPNVHLVDTNGQGVEKVTEDGIFVNGKEYPVDVIIWSTGYGSPLTDSVAGKAEIKVKGKDGQDMEEVNQQLDLDTLHGVSVHGFPNLFFSGLSQSGVGVNQVQRMERQAEHIAYIIGEAEKKSGEGKKTVIEPTREACKQWGDEIGSAAHLTSGIAACTPSYFNLEGDSYSVPPEVGAKMARMGIYGQGYLKYVRMLDAWEADGKLSGVAVAAA